MRLLKCLLLLFISTAVFAQPKNDSCVRSKGISISQGGYGTGVFSTDTFNITTATIEGAEYFHPDLVSVGNDKKSIWFRFYLPVKRAVKIELIQPSTKINAKDAGFVTYKANSCYPGLAAATSAYITPLNQFGSSFHPCMEAGWYMVQVGAKSGANGPVYMELSISYPIQHASVNSSKYDLTDSAYNFGTLSVGRNEKFIEYETGCHTLQDSAEYYPYIGSDHKDYTQTSWHVFKTGRRIDYLEIFSSEAITNPMVYFPAGTKIFANVYEGDVKTSNYKTLTRVDTIRLDFDNRITSKGFAGRAYMCNLKPSTSYSIQLVFKHDFFKQIRLTIRQRTSDSATLSPQPIRSALATSSKLGVLPSSSGGTQTVLKDYLSCQSRLINNACGKVNPASGIVINGYKYDLTTWASFKLADPANLAFEFLNTANNQCEGKMAYRLFKDSIPSSCASLDTTKIFSKGLLKSAVLFCVPPGNYSLQILGMDTADYQCGSSDHLGYNINIGIKVFKAVQFSKFGLSDSARIDSINSFKPLVHTQTYNAKSDEFGCGHSVLPGANRCDTAHKKAIYRLIKIGDADADNLADSGLLSVFNLKTNQGPEKIQYALYNKNLRQLAISQNKFMYPDTLGNPGLLASCTYYNVAYNGSSSRYYCVTPGDYTLAAFGGDYHLGIKDQPQFIFTKTTTKYSKPGSPENMDTIKVSTNSKIDFFSCLNNAEVIDGAIPCGDKKVIYREFYLSTPQLVEITNYDPASFAYIGSNTLYKGRISAGKSGLRLNRDPDGRRWECFTKIKSNDCYPLAPGWYTIISSTNGPGYNDKVPLDDAAHQNSGNVNGKNRISINIIAQIASKYNRPFKAWPVNDSLNSGKPLSWKPNYGTMVNPKNGYIFNLRPENFTCVPDTPLSMHPITTCGSNLNHIAYYVFGLKEESYLRVMGLNPDVKAYIFDFDVRKDSSKMTSTTPLQSCNTFSRVEMCRIQPGTYTLVLMCSNAASFPMKVSPALYIDSVGTSRFDFAKKAYDFGKVEGDSVWYSGKKGTTHPSVSGRAASSDFFFCTTGGSTTDPLFACGGYFNPNVYPDKKNNALYNVDSVGNKYTYLGYHSLRNLWYTFTLKGAGKAKIKIENLTNGSVWGNNLSYGVYLSDEKGNLNIDTLRKYGRIDSTSSMGLTQIEYKPSSGYCNGTDWLSVTKDICDSVSERRYYVVISLNEVALPNLNSQIAVSIIYDSVPIPSKNYDKYSQANRINGLNQVSPPYTNTLLASGTFYKGAPGFFVGSTTDTADQTIKCTTYGKKNGTIWYKFFADSTGTILLNLRRYTFSSSYSSFFDYTPSNNQYNDNIVLLKEIVAGDSTTKGLQKVSFDYNSVTYGGLNRDFATTCINRGWYYIQLSSCGLECSDMLQPEMVLLYQKGDFCKTPVPLNLSILGTTTGTAIVNCHSIGEGYGENGSNMGCLYGPKGYKSTWFRIDYGDSAKADIEFKLSENTNVLPSDIRFRTFYGGCSALTPGPCNTNSQTIFSLTCMKKGSYFVQVVTPSTTTGSLDLQVTAKKNLDTSCKPYSTWTPNANYSFKRLCPQNKVTFTNYSTNGDSVGYLWDFGFGKKDTIFAPTVTFPTSASDVTYKVKLIVFNITRSASDSIIQNITIPATPVVKLRADTAVCKGDTVIFKYSNSKYRHYWQNGSNKNEFKVSSTQWVVLTVIQKFGNDSCILYDSAFVKVNPNPIFKFGNDTTLCLADSIIVRGPAKMASYQWNNSKTVQSQKIGGGIYLQLEVTDSNKCKASDDIATALRTYSDTIFRQVKPVCVDITVIKVKVKPTYAGTYYGHANIDNAGQFFPKTAGSGNHKVYYSFKDNIGCIFKDSTIIKVNAMPDASINSTGPFCLDGGVQTISPKTTNGGKFYGGSYIDSSGKFNPAAAAVGWHNVVYQLKDANQCVSKDSIQILVNALPDASINSAGPFCIDAGIKTITAKTTAGGKFYGGSFIDSVGNFNPKNASPGIHKVYYFYKDANQCSARDSIVVKVNPLPDASINTAGPFCIDAGVKTMTPKTNTGGKFSGGTFIDQNGKFDPRTAGAGNHKIFYAFSDTNGCFNFDSIMVRVNTLPDASIIASGPFCIDAGIQTVKAKTNPGGKFKGGNFIDSAGQFNPLNASIGINKIYYMLTDMNGCVNGDSSEITVNPLPDASIKQAGPFCIDAGIQIMIPQVNGGGKFYGGSFIDSAGNFNPRIAGSGKQTILYTFTDANKCIGVDSTFIWIDTLPNSSIIPAGPFCIDAGVKTILPKANIGGQFYGGNYIDSSGIFDPDKAASGLHKIIYKFTDVNYCTSKDSILIRVNLLPDARINPAGPYCVDAGLQIVTPKTNSGGKFYGGIYVDSSGNFNPTIATVGIHKLVYTITDINGCTNKDSITIRVDKLPDASINNAGPYCVDANIQTITGKINKGGKFFGGAYIDSLGKFNPKLAGVGLHKVLYRFKDGNKCINTDSIYIKINPLPDASIIAAGPYCVDAGVQNLKPKTNIGGQFSGGIYIDAAGKFNPSVAGIGSHKVIYKFTDANTCFAKDSTNIVVNALPDATIILAGPFCTNNVPAILKPRVNPGGKFYGGAYIDSAGIFDNLKAGIGKHKVVYKITDGYGCRNKDSIIITVNGLPDARINPAGPFCDNDGVKIITPTSTPGGLFYGGPYVDAIGNFNPAVAAAGDHQVLYKVTDKNTCINKDSILVKVNAKPVFNFTAEPLKGCEPLIVNFEGGQGFKKYEWDFGNKQKALGQLTQTVYSGDGKYTVTLKVTDNNNCVATINKPDYITTYQRPKADFNYAPFEINMSVTPVEFTNYTSGDSINNYRWDVEDVFETNNQDFSKIFYDSGNIKISLLAVNKWGCRDSTTQYIFVIDTFIIFVPNTFSPNADGINDEFRVGGIGIRNLEMTIYNRWGEKLFYRKDDSNSFGWDGTYLGETVQEGSYMFTISARDSKKHPYYFKGMVTVLK
ncbi:MAG: PKD domain-containing protein [Bacteroidia bacterium]